MSQGHSQLIRIIPGAAGDTHLTALVLSQTDHQLSMDLHRAIQNSNELTFVGTASMTGATLHQPATFGGLPSAAQITVTRLAAVAYENGFVHVFHVRVDGLTPATPYALVVRDGGESRSETVQTFGNDHKPFRVGVWSCYHHDNGSGPRLATAIQRAGVHMKLLIGDNIYLDQPLRLENPVTEVPRRYLERIFSSAYADALAVAPTYTTWDDHEFWNNYPETQFWLKQSKGALGKVVETEANDALDLFQHTLNVGVPAVLPLGAPDPKKHRSFSITSTPHVSFFVMDVRSQREVDNGGKSKMMPADALKEFQKWAEGLKRPGILVLGQPLWIGPGDYFDYNPPRFREQYDAIWRAILDAPFDIFVLSGDVHHSRLIRLEIKGETLKGEKRQCTVYECLSTPANHIPEGTATVSFPGELEGSHWIPGQPRLHSPSSGGYIMGTDSRSTFAILDICRFADEKVGIQVTFYDMAGRGPSSLPIVAINEAAAITTEVIRSRTKQTRRYAGQGVQCKSPFLLLGRRPDLNFQGT